MRSARMSIHVMGTSFTGPGILECLTRNILMIVLPVEAFVFQSNRVTRMSDGPADCNEVECFQRIDQPRAHVGQFVPSAEHANPRARPKEPRSPSDHVLNIVGVAIADQVQGRRVACSVLVQVTMSGRRQRADADQQSPLES